MRIHFGISTCPNDTFAVHAILQKRIDLRGLEFHMELLDVEQLNERLLAGAFDASKASYHAALHLSEEVGVLSSGSALGFGVGPLLLAARRETHPSQPVIDRNGRPRPAIVLCPGRYTTATLLYRLLHPDQGRLKQVVFSEIMPALEAQAADFGVCIHEGRFTWQRRGLALVEDLGSVWEQQAQTPLPLGGIVARHALGGDAIRRLQAVLRDSICYGLEHRQETARTMRQYAQEFSDEVLFAHVDLYVNRWTVDLGETGRRALDVLQQRARQVGMVSAAAAPLAVY